LEIRNLNQNLNHIHDYLFKMQYEITSECEQGVKSVQIRRSNHVAVTSPVKPRRSGEKGWARRSGEQVWAVSTSERVCELSGAVRTLSGEVRTSGAVRTWQRTLSRAVRIVKVWVELPTIGLLQDPMVVICLCMVHKEILMHHNFCL